MSEMRQINCVFATNFGIQILTNFWHNVVGFRYLKS